MSRRSKIPSVQCPKCGAKIVVIPQGKKYRACELEKVAVITEQGLTAIGWRRHKCSQAPSTLKNLIDTQKTTLGTMPQGEEKP